ncbi:MAG: nickel-dependent lactate racemase [Spirochaetaceae bacterium]
MGRYAIPYGKTTVEFELPDEWSVERIVPAHAPPVARPKEAVERALAKPVGAFSWDTLGAGLTVAIAVNDKTRPVPHEHLLPPLLSRLEAAGVRPEAIRLIVATGTHPPMAPEELPGILPADILSRYEVISHDATREEDLATVGETARGTPMRINRRFLEADARIVIGNIEPHQFMGFSGGVKSAVIGLAAKETINHNHAMMSRPEAVAGRFEDNPARQDVEEMGRLVRVDLALNAILNDDKQIIEVIAGEPAEVMRRGIPRVRELYTVEIAEPCDLVIASPGGHPKDINVYQSQKALAHAAGAVREGGGIVVAAACPEGSGSESFERWVSARRSHEQVIADFRAEGFRVGPHKAYQVAREATRYHTLWVTDMPAALTETLLLERADTLEAAVEALLRRGGATGATGGTETKRRAETARTRPRIGIIPYANATMVQVRGGGEGE